MQYIPIATLLVCRDVSLNKTVESMAKIQWQQFKEFLNTASIFDR